MIVEEKSCVKDCPQLQAFLFHFNTEPTWCPFSVTEWAQRLFCGFKQYALAHTDRVIF